MFRYAASGPCEMNGPPVLAASVCGEGRTQKVFPFQVNCWMTAKRAIATALTVTTSANRRYDAGRRPSRRTARKSSQAAARPAAAFLASSGASAIVGAPGPTGSGAASTRSSPSGSSSARRAA